MTWRCDGMPCKRPDDPFVDIYRHMFSGYGFMVAYHPECCPGSVDGSNCDDEHPDGWEPEDPETFAAVAAEQEARRKALREGLERKAKTRGAA